MLSEIFQLVKETNGMLRAQKLAAAGEGDTHFDRPINSVEELEEYDKSLKDSSSLRQSLVCFTQYQNITF